MPNLAPLFLLTLAACVTAPERAAPTASDANSLVVPSVAAYQLAPGDVLAIKVYREPDLSGKYRIDPDGTLNFPLLGRISVVGQTADWTEKMLEYRLANGFLVEPDVQLSVTEFKPVYVDGAVSKTGEYRYKLGLTVQQAITLAGGLNRFAAEKFYIQRNGESPDKRFRATADTLLFPGDILTVEERIF